ncbi:hypothetical protein [Geomesophilobacter sediminis]|uniref:Uncharacterized protein n=1 Tax=Geomesophilobacter sediminis TaxID=2798584 RepID=A0A8J7M1J4_9BACT|nr:hypothetical protein [Geomesophilobacter sediminis]MBJ6726949.1 hypothetical protein [Geomesophilobacter sediminis]
MEECKDQNHKEHICALTAKGDISQVHRLSLHPEYECNRCGARVHDLDRVCDPRDLPDIGDFGDGADVKS